MNIDKNPVKERQLQESSEVHDVYTSLSRPVLLQDLCELHMCHSLLGAKLGYLHAGVASAQDPSRVDTSIWRILLSIPPQVFIHVQLHPQQ